MIGRTDLAFSYIPSHLYYCMRAPPARPTLRGPSPPPPAAHRAACRPGLRLSRIRSARWSSIMERSTLYRRSRRARFAAAPRARSACPPHAHHPARVGDHRRRQRGRRDQNIGRGRRDTALAPAAYLELPLHHRRACVRFWLLAVFVDGRPQRAATAGRARVRPPHFCAGTRATLVAT